MDSATNVTASRDESGRHTWQIGGVVLGGFPPFYKTSNPALNYREQLTFLSAGLEVGRVVTKERGPGLLHGQGEILIELLPYWQVHHPQEWVTVYLAGSHTPSYLAQIGAYDVYGVSVTPLLFRWNFIGKRKKRFIPWVQPGMGLLWTNIPFPQGYGPQGNHVSPSSLNFTPQVGFGANIFLRKNEALEVGLRATHVTDFGLTSFDPGVNVVAEVTAGYSWWFGGGHRRK